jgi:nucleotide-binding universal stress UspA family protein
MYANILLCTDGSDAARKGVKHVMDLAKALNAKAAVITVTEPLPIDYWSGPSQEELDHFDAASKERASKVLDASTRNAVLRPPISHFRIDGAAGRLQRRA